MASQETADEKTVSDATPTEATSDTGGDTSNQLKPLSIVSIPSNEELPIQPSQSSQESQATSITDTTAVASSNDNNNDNENDNNDNENEIDVSQMTQVSPIVESQSQSQSQAQPQPTLQSPLQLQAQPLSPAQAQFSFIMTKQERKKWKQFGKAKQQCLKILNGYKSKRISNDNKSVNCYDNGSTNINPFVTHLEDINSVLDDIDNIFFNNYNILMNRFIQTEIDCNNEWRVNDDEDTDTDSEDEDNEDENNANKIDTIAIMNVCILEFDKLNAFCNNYQNGIDKNLSSFKFRLNEMKKQFAPNSNNNKDEQATNEDDSKNENGLTSEQNGNNINPNDDMFTPESDKKIRILQRDLSIEKANVKTLKDIILELQTELSHKNPNYRAYASHLVRVDSTKDRDFDFKIVSIEHPGDVFRNGGSTIAWHIQNTGKKPFNEENNIKLGFVSGDGLLVSNYEIPNANINETIFIKLNFYAFNKCGVYNTIFRLTHNGTYFGPRLQVKINVIDENEIPTVESTMKSAASASASQGGHGSSAAAVGTVGTGVGSNSGGKGRGPSEMAPRVSGGSGASQVGGRSTPGGVTTPGNGNGNGNGNVTSAIANGEDVLMCLCGKELIVMKVRDAYKGKKVYCDICRKQCYGLIFHCPNGNSKEHRGGFDLCGKCGSSQQNKVY